MPAMNDAIAKLGDLHSRDVHADACGRSLIGAHREHGGTECTRTQPRDAERDPDEGEEAQQSELDARERVTGADAEVETEQLGIGN